MVGDYTTRYFKEIKDVLDGIDVSVLDRVVNTLFRAYHNENQIFVMGNGGSASAASHFACDINKGACHPFLKKFRVISLSDNIALITAYANDLSYENIFVEQMKNFLRPEDVVIGISGSGESKNVLKAIEFANAGSAVTIGFTGFDGGRLGRLVKHNLNAAVNDMQKVEDIHLMLIHLIMQIIQKQIEAKTAALR